MSTQAIAAEHEALLEEAIARGDAEAALRLSGALLDFLPHAREEPLDAHEADRRRAAYERFVASMLRVHESPVAHAAWRTWVLPSAAGVLTHSLWITTARWLRALDALPDESTPAHLRAEDLLGRSVEEQAIHLVRYCLVHDGERAIDASAVASALDDALWPFFFAWLLGAYAASPSRIEGGEAWPHQEEALSVASELLSQLAIPLATGPATFEVASDAAYASEQSTRELSEVLLGSSASAFFEALLPVEPTHLSKLDELHAGDHILVAPSWRADHVIHRCLAPLLEGERRRGAVALRVLEPGQLAAGEAPEDWRSVEYELDPSRHHLLALGQVAEDLSRRSLEFAFFPEILPSNASAWLATRRLARVQATGYGSPMTSGLPTMDYFIGGAEVEGPNAQEHYSEQLVLLPGLGVSTTPPPTPTAPRRRPEDDERLVVASAAALRKLNAPLLRAWNAILADSSRASFDLYPALPPTATKRWLPAIAAHIRHEDATLHALLPRDELVGRWVEADLYLDSYPFGGFNTLVEVLASGCPFVTLEGDLARNRFGAAVLRRVGLPEFLIAKSWEEYVLAATRVLTDTGLRLELRARLADRERVLAALIDADADTHFDAALERMRRAGPRDGRAGAAWRVPD